MNFIDNKMQGTKIKNALYVLKTIAGISTRYGLDSSEFEPRSWLVFCTPHPDRPSDPLSLPFNG